MAVASEDKSLKQSGETLLKAIRKQAEAARLSGVMQLTSNGNTQRSIVSTDKLKQEPR